MTSLNLYLKKRNIYLVLSALLALLSLMLYQLIGIHFLELNKILFISVISLNTTILLVFLYQQIRLNWYKKFHHKLDNLLKINNLNDFEIELTFIKKQLHKDPILLKEFASITHEVDIYHKSLIQSYLEKKLLQDTQSMALEIESRLDNIKKAIPLFQVREKINTSLESLLNRRKELKIQWDENYPSFSWWNKLKYADGPDFSEMDKAIKELKKIKKKLISNYDSDFQRLDAHLDSLKLNANKRVTLSQSSIKTHISSQLATDKQDYVSMQNAFWLSMFSLPISMWDDALTAHNIYDTLRDVNSNYADMTDMEIWWHTLFMDSDQLAGLVSLTKGAYFERLVADDTGGELFEHFNHRATDIIIDGEAFQLKATASEAYVRSVPEDIPVITTSEVAEYTDAIDSGYSNDELQEAVELALGGAYLDVDDSVADAILTGIGSLGLFASLRGITHAAEKYNNGGDGVEAAFEGLGIAIEGTARGLVNTAEMGYKIITSKPSRLIGSLMLSGAKKLDEKLFEIKSSDDNHR